MAVWLDQTGTDGPEICQKQVGGPPESAIEMLLEQSRPTVLPARHVPVLLQLGDGLVLMTAVIKV